MKQSKKLFASILLLLLAAACVPSDLVLIQEPVAEQEIAAAETPTEAPSAAPVAPTAAPTPTAAATAIALMPARADSNCLICHSNQETLIAVAAPPEEPEDSLSSGVG